MELDGIGCAGCDRRTFLLNSAILTAAAALAACGGSSSTEPSIASGTTIRVADFATLSSVGGVAITSLGNAPVAIVRTGASAFVVLSRVCPHQGGIVNQNGSAGFTCPVHGARFDQSGSWIGGQPTSSLHMYASTYDASTNVITVT